jgi:hypothetical protein
MEGAPAVGVLRGCKATDGPKGATLHVINESGRRMRLAATLLAVSIGALILAQPSSADSWVKMSGASATFKSYGEKFRIWDLKCPGVRERHARARHLQRRPGARGVGDRQDLSERRSP